MQRAALDPNNPTLDELKRRGDRARAQVVESTRRLRITVNRSEELRSKVDRLHHSASWSLDWDGI